MNTRPFLLFLLSVLTAGLALIPDGHVQAQTFTVLHTFSTRGTSGINSDGALPESGLILSGNTLYGTAFEGGSLAAGTVFAVNTDGSGFTNLSSFTGATPAGAYGAAPEAGLVLSGNTLYGTAAGGGVSQGNGTVFKVNINGTGFAAVHVFTATHLSSLHNATNSDGAFPRGGLILSGNTLFGTASNGGTNGPGTVFKVNTDGNGFATLHSFMALATNTQGIKTNSDGANPYAGLVLSGNTLYGTTILGGNSGFGTVFGVNTDGTGFTTLHSFNFLDGATPTGGLVLSGNTLYGTTANPGTVFSISTGGTDFKTIYVFTAAGLDGGYPAASLILSGNTLYGTTEQDGAYGSGTVFAVNTAGSGFTTLSSFGALVGTAGFSGTNSDGAWPAASLILSGNTLYGTAFEGGSSGWGTVFSISLGSVSVSSPRLSITPFGTYVILTWPTNAAGFTLQSVTNLPSGSWSNITSGITTIGTNYAFSNAVSGEAAFFRLKQ